MTLLQFEMERNRRELAKAMVELERKRAGIRNLVEAALVLAEYRAWGPRGHYASKEAFLESRRRYKRAHGLIYAREHGYSHQPPKKHNRKKLLRSDAAVREFYREVHTAERMQCHYCWRPLTPVERVVDHIVPLAKGGEHAVENLCCACIPCNSLKSDLPLEDFYQRAIQRLCFLA